MTGATRSSDVVKDHKTKNNNNANLISSIIYSTVLPAQRVLSTSQKVTPAKKHRLIPVRTTIKLDRSHLGRYSVAALQAFQDYSKLAPWWWKLLVIMLFPIPACGVVTLLNLLPLKSPKEGLAANYMFFIRTYADGVLFATAVRWQRECFIGWKTPSKWNLVIANAASLIFVAMILAFTKAAGVFPIPFSPLVVLSTSLVIAIKVLTIVLKKDRHMNSAEHGLNNTILVKKYKRLLAFESSLIFVYSIFMMGFRRLEGFYQAMYACLLLPLKYALTLLAERLVAHVEDLAVESVVFSVEFFNCLYVSISMGGATTFWTSSALIAFDFVHMAYSMYRLNIKAKRLVELHLQEFGDIGATAVIDNCLHFAHANKETLERRSTVRFRTANGLTFQVNRMFAKTLRGKSRIQIRSATVPEKTKAPTIQWMDDTNPAAGTVMRTQHANAFEPKKQLLGEILNFMYLLERVVLTEYVEVFVPVVYACYAVAAFYGPNRFFIYGILSMSEKQLWHGMKSVLLYGLVEYFSLLVLYVLVKWRFGLNVFSVLAFVLETHFFNIQSKIVLFLVITLYFALVHNGMDFDFRFEYQTHV